MLPLLPQITEKRIMLNIFKKSPSKEEKRKQAQLNMITEFLDRVEHVPAEGLINLFGKLTDRSMLRIDLSQVSGNDLTRAFQNLKPTLTCLHLGRCRLDLLPIEALCMALKSLPNTLRMVNLGLTTSLIPYKAENLAKIRQALENKEFIVRGIGCDAELADASLKQVISIGTIQGIVKSYLKDVNLSFFAGENNSTVVLDQVITYHSLN